MWGRKMGPRRTPREDGERYPDVGWMVSNFWSKSLSGGMTGVDGPGTDEDPVSF